jgi:hypothetical protein
VREHAGRVRLHVPGGVRGGPRNLRGRGRVRGGHGRLRPERGVHQHPRLVPVLLRRGIRRRRPRLPGGHGNVRRPGPAGPERAEPHRRDRRGRVALLPRPPARDPLVLGIRCQGAARGRHPRRVHRGRSAGRDLHGVDHGLGRPRPRVRSPVRRSPLLLGRRHVRPARTRRRIGALAGDGHVLRDRRRRRAHVRARRHPGTLVLGTQRSGAARRRLDRRSSGTGRDRERQDVEGDRRRRRAHVRSPVRRHALVLGRERVRAARSGRHDRPERACAGRGVLDRRRMRRPAHVRHEGGRRPLVLGIERIRQPRPADLRKLQLAGPGRDGDHVGERLGGIGAHVRADVRRRALLLRQRALRPARERLRRPHLDPAAGGRQLDGRGSGRMARRTAGGGISSARSAAASRG